MTPFPDFLRGALVLAFLLASMAAPTALAQQRDATERDATDRLSANRTAPTEPVYRSGELILTVDSAYDDPDFDPGDGLCANNFGECTLRAAIDEANAQPDQQPVDIEFNIGDGPPGAEIAPGVWRIQPNFDDGFGAFGPLPTITQPNTRIDGATQPGASCGDLITGPKHDLRVVLDGSLLTDGDGIFGDNFDGSLTVRGLVVQNFPDVGIIAYGDNSLVECNYVGTDYTGEAAAGNGNGILLDGGTAQTAQSNLVSASVSGGIDLVNGTSAMVARNLVGSDADGNQPLGNGGAGLTVFNCTDVTLTTNLVSANSSQGIFIDFNTNGAVLTNNTVGLTKNRGVGPGGMGNDGVGLLVFEASDNDIGLPGSGQGNFVGGNGGSGIQVEGETTSDIRIRGNTVGLTFNGNAAPNGSFGVVVGAFLTRTDGSGEGPEVGSQRGALGGGPTNITVGGLAAGEGNTISGNTLSGVGLSGDSGTHVEGNTIGLNAAGAVRPNGSVGDGFLNSGIEVNFSFDPVIVGNTISGNNGSGIRFAFNQRGGDEGQRSNGGLAISDNRIGTNATGTAARPNVESGLVLTNGANFASVTGNTISGNTDTGVFLSQNVTGVTLENNFIGTNAAGANLGNGLPGGDGQAGIFCQSASGVRIGQNFQPNTIRFNGADGIFLSGACQDISIVGNVISDNGELGVDLAPNGPNPNDVGDGDTGANGKLNFPVIASAENDGTDATIAWVLDAEPNTEYQLLFCRTDTPDPSGFGECPVPNAVASTTTNGSGNAAGTLTLGAANYPAGAFVTANATEVDGPLPQGYRATSEFGAAVQVADTGAPPLAVTITPTSPTPPVVLQRGDFVFFDVTFTVSASGPSSFEFWTEAVLPNNSVRSPLIGVNTISVTPPATVTQSFSQRVPGVAPFGSYTYRAEVGTFPSGVVDSDAFAAQIVSGREHGPDDWQAYDAAGALLDGPQRYDFRTKPASGEVEAASSEALPEAVELKGAYPNPFSGSARVSFALPEAGRVVLAVYDVLGREVARLMDGELEAGRHAAVLDGSGLPSGVYLVRMTTGDGFAKTQRITLVR